MKINNESLTKIPTVNLNNSYTIPTIGIGPGGITYKTWVKRKQNTILGKFCFKVNNKLTFYYARLKYINSIAHALKLGYRLIDFSFAYGSGKEVMRAIKKAGVKRDEIIITSRVSNKQQYLGPSAVRQFFFQSLDKMGLDYIDIYMFHWPVTDHYLDTYKEIIKLYKEGYVKAIGVANCHQHHLDTLINETGIIPAINQIEVHPLFSQKPLIEYCQKRGIYVESYTPIARNDDRLEKNKILQGLAEKYNKSIPQIILRWHTQLGLIPVPRSSNFTRQFENMNIFDFCLSKEEIKSIDSININSRLRFDPDNLDFTSVG